MLWHWHCLFTTSGQHSYIPPGGCAEYEYEWGCVVSKCRYDRFVIAAC